MSTQHEDPSQHDLPVPSEAPGFINTEYEALGIRRDTWTCFAVLDPKDAKKLIVDLALGGVAVMAAHDLAGDKIHVSVQGGAGGNPAAYITVIRGGPLEALACTSALTGQHPTTTAPR